MTMNNCLSHCVHWAGGKCRLENVRGTSFGAQDCPHFDHRVAGRTRPGITMEL